MDKTLAIFGERLKEARKARGWTQDKLAQETGLLNSAISHFETGRREPNLKNLVLLIRTLECEASWILGVK